MQVQYEANHALVSAFTPYVLKHFQTSQIKKIVIVGSNKNDSIYIDPNLPIRRASTAARVRQRSTAGSIASSINGGDGNDLIYGHGFISGGNGNDTVWGKQPRATRSGAGTATTCCLAGTGTTRSSGSSGHTTINGGQGKDKLFAGKGDAVIHGGYGP